MAAGASLGGTSVNFGFSANKSFFQNNLALQSLLMKERKRQEEEGSRSKGDSSIKGGATTGDEANASILNASDIQRLHELGEQSTGGKSSTGADTSIVNFNLTQT